jgi:serine/threonine protein phosphatase PrpC
MHELDAQRAPGLEAIALASRSDAGRVRTENQDAIALLENTSRERLIVVADGMGGHSGGETASRICVQMLERIFREPHGTPEQRLHRGLDLANEEIYSHALANTELRGMGTTAVVVLIAPDGRAWLAWVGDSRCYRLRGGALEPLTRDHSLMSEWISIGVITAAAAETHPRRHELTRALGQAPDVPIDLVPLELRPGDRLLLCSDGLHGSVSDRTLKSLLARGTPDEVARTLVDAANGAGGTDNVSVVVVEMPAAPTTASVAPPIAPEIAPAIALVAQSELPHELELVPPPMLAPEIEPMPDLTPDIAAELTVEPAQAIASPPAPLSSPEIGFDSNPEFSFADLGAEIADVVNEAAIADAAAAVELPVAVEAAIAEPAIAEKIAPLELAPLELAPTPQPEPAAVFLLPAEQQIQIPRMTPVKPKRGLDLRSAAAGIAGTLAVVGLCIALWLYTGADHAPEAAKPARPAPVVVHAPPPAPAVVPTPAPAKAAAPITKPVAKAAPAPAKPVAVPEPAPFVKAAPPSEPVAKPIATPESAVVPAAAEASAAEPLAVEPPPSANGFELPPDVVRFVDDWLQALAAHDRTGLEALGFADLPSAFAGTRGTRDGFRLLAADIDEERSVGGRIYLRMVVSYAFRDANGRFRTQDEQRLILRDVDGALRFEGRWQQ